MSIPANVAADFAKRKSAPSLLTTIADDGMTLGQVATPATVISSPILGATPSPTLGAMPAPMLSTQRNIVTTIGSPSYTGATRPVLPLGTTNRSRRASSNFDQFTVGGASTSTRIRGLSFDIPSTPESAYIGGSTGSMYSFGMPPPAIIETQPTIQELEREFGFTVPPRPAKVLGTNIVPGTTVVNPFNAAPGHSTLLGTSTISGTTTAVPTSNGTANTLATTTMQSTAGAAPFIPGQGLYSYGMMQGGPPGYYMPMPMQMAGFEQGGPSSAPGTFPPSSAAAPGISLSLGELIGLPPSSSREGGYSAPSSNTANNYNRDSANDSSGPTTTVMLRNIPLKYNREGLLADLDQRGFPFTYDFFYLPIDFHTGNNVGYAFINFLDEPTVERFRATYNGLQLSADSAKICEVSNAKAQGKMKNVEQYRNSSVMSMEDRYQPVVFENGVRQPFPPPTRSLKPVKPRARPT